MDEEGSQSDSDKSVRDAPKSPPPVQIDDDDDDDDDDGFIDEEGTLSDSSPSQTPNHRVIMNDIAVLQEKPREVTTTTSSGQESRVEVPEYFQDWLRFTMYTIIRQPMDLSPDSAKKMYTDFTTIQYAIEKKYGSASRFGMFWRAFEQYRTMTVTEVRTLPAGQVCVLDGNSLQHPAYQVRMIAGSAEVVTEHCTHVNKRYRRFVELCFKFRRQGIYFQERCKRELDVRRVREYTKDTLGPILSYEKNRAWFIEEYRVYTRLEEYIKKSLQLS